MFESVSENSKGYLKTTAHILGLFVLFRTHFNAEFKHSNEILISYFFLMLDDFRLSSALDRRIEEVNGSQLAKMKKEYS